MKAHLFSLKLLYLVTVLAVTYIAATGWDYYRLPLGQRPYHEHHRDYKPSGAFGHGFGIVGSVLIMTLLLYTARKRFRFMQRWGNIRFWLNYHIWMGVTGPLLIIFHSAFKVGGIIAISFWSMVAVAVSGALGRYLYIQIPRSLSGQELTTKDLLEQEETLLNRLRTDYDLGDTILSQLQKLISTGEVERKAGWRDLVEWLVSDLTLPFKLRAVIRDVGKSAQLDRSTIGYLKNLVRRLTLLKRRMAFLQTARSLLHHWHIIHKPFAIVMILIMIIHIFVAVLFGYAWVF